MFDALLLSLPIQHGAIGNPIFAFFMEGAAFLFLTAVIKEKFYQKKTGQAVLGGASALMAVGLFPLVKFATGIPACVYPGTGIPLSLYFAPLAVVFSILTVPMGFWMGEKCKVMAAEFGIRPQRKALKHLVSPAAFILCLVIVACIRLV